MSVLMPEHWQAVQGQVASGCTDRLMLQHWPAAQGQGLAASEEVQRELLQQGSSPV